MRNFVPIILVFLFGQVLSAAEISPSTARIAVIGVVQASDLSALLTAEMSKKSGIVMVERDDLAKVGDEAKVQQLAGSDPVALGKLLQADGLLFVKKENDEICARLTAVNLGYVLFDDRYSGNSSAEAIAKIIAHKTDGYLLKLKLTPDLAIPISILNLRAEVPSSTLTEIERKLTLLLESRLTAVPQVVVLERRHAWSVAFEKSLTTENQKVLRGTHRLDGTLRFSSDHPEELQVNMRLRRQENTLHDLVISGRKDDLPGMVDLMMSEVLRQIGKTLTPDGKVKTGSEAREYLEEGIWSWKHQSFDSGLEALDSSELLGEKATADIAALRVNMMMSKMECYLPGADPRLPAWLKADAPSTEILADRMMAILSYAVAYREEKMESRLELLNPKTEMSIRTSGIETKAINQASCLIKLLDQKGSAKADELRAVLRPLTKYDPFHGQAGLRQNWEWRYGIYFADCWSQSVEEELAFYRLQFTDANARLPNEFYFKQGRDFCERFIKKREDRDKAFADLLESLKNDPNAKWLCLAFQCYSSDEKIADAALDRYFGELWKNHEELVKNPDYRSEWLHIKAVPAERLERHAAKALPLLHYYLVNRQSYKDGEGPLVLLWHPKNFPPEEAATLWKEYEAFKKRIAPTKASAEYGEVYFLNSLKPFDEAFAAQFPDIVAQSKNTDAPRPLIVQRFWNPYLNADGPDTLFGCQTMTESDRGLWVVGMQGQTWLLYSVNLETFKEEAIPLPPGVKGISEMHWTPEALYLFKYSAGIKELCRYDMAAKTWEVRRLDQFLSEPFTVINRKIYFRVRGGDRENGLALYDWAEGKTTILASNRRRPAQNQFDEESGIKGVFLGNEGKVCAQSGIGTFLVQEEPGNWTKLHGGTLFDEATTYLGKTLVYNYHGEITLFDPEEKLPQHMMPTPAPIVRGKKGDPDFQGKTLSPWADETIWDAPGFRLDKQWMGYRNGMLYILSFPVGQPGGGVELLCYTKATGRKPVRVPLQLRFDENDRAKMTKLPGLTPKSTLIDELEHPDKLAAKPGLFIMNQGLCIRYFMTGFWFVPYKEIDAYLQANLSQ